MITSCQKEQRTKLYITIPELKINIDKYYGKEVNIVGYLIRSTNGLAKQDYVLLPQTDYTDIKGQSFKEYLGLIISSLNAEKGFELDESCVNSWVSIRGLIGENQFSVRKGWVALTDPKDNNGNYVPMIILNIGNSKGIYGCKWKE